MPQEICLSLMIAVLYWHNSFDQSGSDYTRTEDSKYHLA